METKTGRNEPCPCGSGKKYKRCCWEANHLPQTTARLKADEQRRAQRAQKDKELRQRLEAMTPEQLAELDAWAERHRARRRDQLESLLGAVTIAASPAVLAQNAPRSRR